jgi:homoserine kinase type II
MTLDEARAALETYDLDVVAVEALDAGSVNSNFSVEARSGERFFVRLYEEQGFAGAAGELGMIRELGERGVPTPPPRPRRDGSYVAAHRGKPVGVHPWVDGQILCFARVTPDATRAVGRALAGVHRATTVLSHVPAGRFGLDGLRERLAHVDRTDARYAADTRRIRERMEFHAARSPSSLPSGLIHGDLFRDNVLWRAPAADQLAPGASAGAGPVGTACELLALLDFESASQGVFVYDLMVCAHAWCYGERFELGLVRAMFEGYQEERRLEPEERAALVHQGALAALRFATTRLTDFSLRAPPGTEPKRDYRRFLARLDALENGDLTRIFVEGVS